MLEVIPVRDGVRAPRRISALIGVAARDLDADGRTTASGGA
jgi:hypothetical protein